MNAEDLFTKIESCSPSEKRSVFAALDAAEAVEQKIQDALALKKPLAGQVCFIKDNFDLPGFPTGASSLFLEEVRPGPHPPGKLVQRLDELGLTVAGKTHMNEFAYGLDGSNPHVGNCPHPFLPRRCSGGSSSGSAWTVANGLAPIAFGTDTGGSIRVPAAFCGLFGFRLPPNDWAKEGCFPLAPRFDSAGWFTRNQKDMNYFTSALLDLPEPHDRPLRIFNAVPPASRLTPTIQKKFPQAKSLSDFTTAELSAKRIKTFNILQSMEALEIHHAWIDTHADRYDPVVRSLILRGRTWTTDEVIAAEKTALEMSRAFEGVFEQADLIILPVHEHPAPPSPMTQEIRSALLTHTVPASLSGLPVLTFPVPTADGPLGIQCVLPQTGWEKTLASLLKPA